LRFLRALVEIDRFLLGLIAQRQRAEEVGKRGDLLDVLLQASDEETGRGMSTQQVRDEMVTTFLAGHETTAISLGWALYLLTQHREAQEMVRAEVDAVLGGRPPAIGDLAALTATRRVIEEALRLFPPVWINPRQALDEDEIDGKRIPAKAMVLMLTYVTHRHPEFWAEPERFDPGRFTPEQVHGRHPLAFQPFGGGSRVCIGMNFALQEMVLFLAAVVQRFSVRLAPGYMFGLDAVAGTLRSRDPLLLEFQER
jgi:cytochrome P450